MGVLLRTWSITLLSGRLFLCACRDSMARAAERDDRGASCKSAFQRCVRRRTRVLMPRQWLEFLCVRLISERRLV
jgi:hypothetical protein